MSFDPRHIGWEEVSPEDRRSSGSRYAEVREALYANRYYDVWGEQGDPDLPVYGVTLGRALRGILPFGQRWRFQQAAHRTVRPTADLRWGPDRKGFRRLIHPNGVCLLGTWEIDAAPEGVEYTGYFRKGSRGLIIGRYSTCCTETRRGHTRSLSLVGKLYPTEDPQHADPLRPADFFTQEDIGGMRTASVDDAVLRNAPDITPWRRGAGIGVFLATVVVLLRADKEPTVRQLYPIAELGKPTGLPTAAPAYMRLVVERGEPRAGEDALDFRDEILARIYDRGDPEPKRALTFNIDVADKARATVLLRKRIRVAENDWTRIGRIVFTEAVASRNGDYVIHFRHPPWRRDRNDPRTTANPLLRA
jgi:hypothetical protein